jgi:hypothetical protein
LRIFPTLISNRSKSEATSAAAAAGCCGRTTASVSREETADDDDEEHDKAVEKENKTGLELIILLPAAAAAAAYSTLFFLPKEQATNTGLFTHADVVMLRPALDSTLAPTIAIATAAGGKRAMQQSFGREGEEKETRNKTRETDDGTMVR